MDPDARQWDLTDQFALRDQLSQTSHPEDTTEFARNEYRRLKGIRGNFPEVVRELKQIRRRLSQIETQVMITNPEERIWSAMEDLSRQISALDRLTDSLEDKPFPWEEEANV